MNDMQSWNAPDSQGVVVLVHGMGEHHGRYRHVGAYLNSRGWNVITGDLPGWGSAPGKKGHIDTFSQYTDTVRRWTETALERAAGQPVFLLGHSMGGLIVTRFAEEYERKGELTGVILSSPCLKLRLKVPGWKAVLARLLDKTWPSLTMPNGVTPDMLTRDREVQRLYLGDPLIYPKVSVHWFQELQRAMGQAWEERHKLDVPMLVLQAGDDQLIDAEAVARFVSGLPASALFRLFPGMRHEVLNEPEKEEVMKRMADWMDGRTK